MTKNQFISDIILRITEGKPSDDLELEPRQVAFWLDMVLGSLVKQSLDTKLLSKKGEIENSYIKWEKDLVLSTNTLDSRTDFYIDLCDEPMNLWRDRGVIRVNTDDGDWVDKMKMSEIDNISKLRFARPTLQNIKYTRVGKRLYFYGPTVDTYQIVKFDVAYVPQINSLEELGDNDQIYVGEDLLPQIAEEVEKIARRQIYQSSEDLQNNAVQNLNGASV